MGADEYLEKQYRLIFVQGQVNSLVKNNLCRPAYDIAYVGRFNTRELSLHIAPYLGAIKHLAGNAHYYPSENEFHITLVKHMKLWHEPEYLKSTKYYEQARQILTKSFLSDSTVNIDIRHILVTETGIILAGYDGGRIAKMRRTLIQNGINDGIYSETRLNNIHPNIVHCTLAMFTADVSLPLRAKVLEAVRGFSPLEITLDRVEARRFQYINNFEPSELIKQIKLRNET